MVLAAGSPGLGIAGAEMPKSRVAGELGHMRPDLRDPGHRGEASTALGLDCREEGRGQELKEAMRSGARACLETELG